jgi:hypothetical protein
MPVRTALGSPSAGRRGQSFCYHSHTVNTVRSARFARAAASVVVASLLAAACGARTGLPELLPGDSQDAGLESGEVQDATLDRGQVQDATLEARSDSSSDVSLDTSFDAGPLPDVVLPLCKAIDAGGDAGPCSGLACQVHTCGGNPAATTVSGYVYAPNGTLPLYNVQVFVPNAPLKPIPKGVQCSQCGDLVSGDPVTTAYSLVTGEFTLTGVPAGKNIPIVVQLGKWRREATIPIVQPCTSNALTDPDLTRLPKNQKEGSMPHIALTTGGCDQMGCMLPKLGIDDAEFGSQADGDNKAVNVYNGSGGSAGLGATAAMSLWGDATVLNTYDEAIFSCECSEAPDTKGTFGSPAFGVVTDYLNAGGRIFTTDFQYAWYKFSPDPNIGEETAGSSTTGLGDIGGGAPVPSPYPGQPPMVLSATIPKSVALAAWLKNIFSGVPLPSGATYPLDSYSQKGEVNPDVIFCNVQSLNSAETVLWASSSQTGGGCTGASPGPRIFTVDTPVMAPSNKQCGRGLHIDAHIDNTAQTVGPGYPTSGCATTLKADEAAFAFFFFDLSSCSETCD